MPLEPDLSGLWIPLVTPFRGDRVDIDAALRLAAHLLHEGARGLVLCGSTGEAAALDAAEQLQLLDAVLDALPGTPVMMGVGGNRLPQVRATLDVLAARPLAGVLVPPPYYVRPSQRGILEWFATLAAASATPLVLYDVPYRTGCTMERATLLELAAQPNIAGVKDCGGDLGKTLALLRDGRLQVLAGEDLQLFNAVAAGAVGGICASAHLFSAHFAAVIARLRVGELEAARRTFAALVPWIEAAFAAPNPSAIKHALALRGLAAAALRPPLTPIDGDLALRIAGMLADTDAELERAATGSR